MNSTPGRHPGNISGKKWVKQNKIKECVEHIAVSKEGKEDFKVFLGELHKRKAFEVVVWASVLKIGVHAEKRGQHWRE